ncbi:MAG: hypothetical protein JW741_30555 [Sedimentisphaerales bacterium]|nr:hypothetical protein [Sedimentisphaerales bacterium]
MKALFIDEPELEFGAGARHIDTRHGLIEHGVLDRGFSSAPKVVRVGVVGSAADIETLRQWIEACQTGIEAKDSHRTTLFVGFPGFGDGKPFCDFVVDDRLVDTITVSELSQIATISDEDGFYEASSKRFLEGGANLIEDASASVVLALLPESFVRRIDVPEEETGARSRRRFRTQERFVWHDAFKAASLRLARPFQVARPATYGGDVHRFTREGKPVSEMQDEATRAWNLFCALYYKAGGMPWRLVREATDLTACFVGISFYHDPRSETLQTSVAQLFNERGEGVIVRGGPAALDERDKTPHLTASDAEKLLLKVLAIYKREHRTMPARLVCHKSSYFNEAELNGGQAAMKHLGIDAYDLLSLRRSRTRLYRSGSYPPLRGTAVVHDEGCLLYTHGSIDFYRCYPGLYTPRTLEVHLDRAEQGARTLMAEILALTKMNWNSTELATLEPVTLDAARGVGSILRYAPENDDEIHTRYSFFM